MVTMIQTDGTGTSGPPESEGRGSPTAVPRPPASRVAAAAPAGARPWATLAAWITLVVVLEAVPWVTGGRPLSLAAGVEQGAARAESRAVGEVSDDQVRKTVQKQHETLPFWTTLALLGDFLADPVALAARAAVVATLLSALAALVGRPIEFGPALAACIDAQGAWVLGLAIRTALALMLGRPEVETSLALVLPPGIHSAATWLAFRQADVFALWGWSAMALGGWRRGQANLLVAFSTCALVAFGEAALRVGFALLAGAGMRLSLLPA